MSKSMHQYSGCHKEQPSCRALRGIRVLIVCHDRYLSGANKALVDWLDGRDRSRAAITVLLPRDNAETRAQLEQLGCEVWAAPFALSLKPLERRGVVWNLKNCIKLVWTLLAHPLISRYVAKKALDQGIQIVHSNSFATTFGAEIARMMRVPHVWHVREFCEADHGFTHYFPNRVARLCEVSHAIFISEAVRDYQCRRRVFKSCVTIYDQVRYDQSLSKSRSFMEDGICNVIMVGAISEGKGQREAIEAIKRLHAKGRNIRLSLCGQGDRSALQPYLAGCEDFVFDLGYRSDVNEIRSGVDIALVCSRMEAFGRVTVEAQYYGNVVIGADAGCTSHLICDGVTGFLYKKGDSEDLAAKLEYCMDNQALMPAIMAAARKRAVSEYASDISGKIFAVYDCVLLSGGAGETHAGESHGGVLR